MNLFHLFRTVVVLLGAVGSVIFAARATGAERAYYSRSTARFTSDKGDFIAAGNGTHLGSYSEGGKVSISMEGEVSGWAILTAANGDELYVTISGAVTSASTIEATISFVGLLSTGHFEDATGSADLVAQFQNDGTIAVVVAGTIDY